MLEIPYVHTIPDFRSGNDNHVRQGRRRGPTIVEYSARLTKQFKPKAQLYGSMRNLG